ncbi:MAG TPA: hypothetical protein VN687_16100 [Blastocatellia bacterium]|nr:hypothetical protein [Blastocatellia bacterium]
MKKQNQRIVAFAYVLISLFATACGTTDNKPTTQPASPPAEQTPTAKSAKQPAAPSNQNQPQTPAITYKEITGYLAVGKMWKVILIPPKVEREQIVSLAREIHGKDPTGFYHFFDDDKQIQRFKDSQVHYPDSKYPSPESWMRKHYIAMINKMLERGGPRWQLVAGDAGLHLTPNPNTTVIAELE